MLYHHDNRDYNVAASAAAQHARGILDKLIQGGTPRAQAVIDKVLGEVPNDHIIKGEDLKFEAVSLNPDDPRARHAIQAELVDEGRFDLHAHAFSQVRERLHIPASYSDYLLGEAGWGAEKLARDMQEIARHENARYLIREHKGQIRGWLSDQYRRLDSRPLLEAFAGSAKEAGLIPIEGYALDTKVAVKAILPQIFEPLPNEVMVFGLKWGNSDYGDGKHNVHAFIMRLWCTNYAIAEDVLSQVHLGGRLPDNLQLTQQTYALDTATSASLMTDVVKDLLSPKRVNGFLEAIKESNEKEINPRNAMEVIKKRLQKGEAEKVIGAFESPDNHNMPEGKTAWRLSNAISWIAGTLEDRGRSLDLMRFAGEVARLPGKEKAS